MSHACIPILVDMPSLVSEILLVFKFAQFSLSDHGILCKLMYMYMYMNNTTL